MAGEFSPEYSDIAAKAPTPIDARESLTRKSQRVKLEMARQALMIDGNTVLEQPETNYRRLEGRLRSSIIGQDQAIDAIIDAMDRSRVRLADNPRPLATLAFLGPTGVGKSETAKLLAEYASGDSSRLIKIDCSNFSHGHEIAGLIGSPPGYVGHEQTPFLSKKKVERHGVVVLFDEIEKGSEPLNNLMLQILGDGQLQLNDGTTANFRDATIILTSNLGAKEMNEHLSKTPVGFGVEKEDPSKDELARSARKAFVDYFKPEFVNRLDAMVVFNPLDKEGLGRVLDNKLAVANEEYVYEYGMAIGLTDGAHEYLVSRALAERNMGARPLVRAFEKDVQSVFGRHLGGQQLSQGSQINVYHRSECTEEIADRFPDQELIFTQRFDEDLWTRKEEYKRQEEEARRKEKEAQRKAEEQAKADVVLFDPGIQNSPDDEPKE